MKAFFRPGLIACCLLGGLWPSAARTADQMPWAADFRTACGLAAEQQRLVLLHFTQDNCPPCRKVEADVFSQAKVCEVVPQNYLPVLVQKEKNPQLVARYQVKLFPTDVIVTPSGLEVYRAISPQQPADYVALLNQVAKQTGTSASRQWAASMGQVAKQAAEQTVATGQQYQRQVIGAAEDLQQNSAIVAQSAEQKVAGTVEQFQQQSGAFNQQAQNTRQQWQQAGQQSAETARLAGQQTAEAVRSSAQSWQQSLNTMQSDLRTAFTPGGAATAPGPTAPVPPNTTPVFNPAVGAPFASGPPTQPPQLPAETRPAVVQQPLLPTANPWFSPEGRAALAAQQPPPQSSPPQSPFVPPQVNVPSPTPSASPALSPATATVRSTGEASTPAQPTSISPTPEVAAVPAPSPPPPSAGPSIAASQAPPIALDGFCVVTLIDSKSWKKADPKFGAIHRGRTYLFTSDAAQRKFLQNPDSFAPVLSGCDPVRFAKTGELVDGKRAYGLITPDNRIFLFADETALQAFEKSPGEFAAAAQQAMLRGATGNRYR